jgi:transcriptional regulator with XRE-family HTH domain
MGTTQTAVARLESGREMPSSRTLQKYADATGHELTIALRPLGAKKIRRGSAHPQQHRSS